MYKVVSPRGETTVEVVASRSRLGDLSGKTVCEIWNSSFRGDVTFGVIRELLQERFPQVKVIPYTEFPQTSVQGGTNQLLEKVDAAIALAKEKGCDAVITGNGF